MKLRVLEVLDPIEKGSPQVDASSSRIVGRAGKLPIVRVELQTTDWCLPRALGVRYREGLLNPESLDSTERLRFRMLMDELFFTWLYRYGSGVVGVEAPTEFVRATLASPGGARYWARARPQFPLAFAAFVDGVAAALPDNAMSQPSTSAEPEAAAQQATVIETDV